MGRNQSLDRPMGGYMAQYGMKTKYSLQYVYYLPVKHTHKKESQYTMEAQINTQYFNEQLNYKFNENLNKMSVMPRVFWDPFLKYEKSITLKPNNQLSIWLESAMLGMCRPNDEK